MKLCIIPLDKVFATFAIYALLSQSQWGLNISI